MEGSTIDIIIFAPLAPILGVILFWFIQLLFIESEKYFLEKIRAKHEPFCRFTNFLGILFQSICHALGYTITKSGISDFYLSVHYGKVAPKKLKKGIFEWVANAFLFIGPFFIPAAMLLLCLFFLMNNGFDVSIPTNLMNVRYTFAGQMNSFGTSLYAFSSNFFDFLINIDLLHPAHFGFILLVIFLGMGIRPSYIGEQKQRKVDMIYDLKNIWDLITHKPLYIVLLLLLSYNFFYVSLIFNQNWYTALFSIFGWISIIAVVSIIIADMILIFIRTTDKIEGYYKIIPFLMLIVLYIFLRSLMFLLKTDIPYSIPLVLTLLTTVLITYLLLQKGTNKFKTKSRIKLFKRKKKRDGKNGRGRTPE